MAIRSHTSATSASKWLLISTVLPSDFNRRIRSLISRVPIGSRPLVGSSNRISSGSLISAWASPIRRAIPLEYSFSCRRLSLFSPTIVISSAARWRRTLADMSNSRP